MKHNTADQARNRRRIRRMHNVPRLQQRAVELEAVICRTDDAIQQRQAPEDEARTADLKVGLALLQAETGVGVAQARERMDETAFWEMQDQIDRDYYSGLR